MDKDQLPDIDRDKIACQQILAEDQSVYSIQWLVLPPETAVGLTTAGLLQLYLEFIERVTVKIIRVVTTDQSIEFRVAGTSLALISFAPPEYEHHGAGTKCSLLIAGGFLVQPKECDRGRLDFMIEPVVNGCRVALRLSDYCPLILGSRRPARWRKWLYRFTQAYLHKFITVRFLEKVYEQFSRQSLQKGVISIAVRKGIDT
jgi:hypothetical protein